jgi:hypothetical protein
VPTTRELVDGRKRPRLVHGDLHAQHLFVAPAAGRLVAVIDFTDAIDGDARYDFSRFTWRRSVATRSFCAPVCRHTDRRRAPSYRATCSRSRCYTNSTCSRTWDPTLTSSASPLSTNLRLRSGIWTRSGSIPLVDNPCLALWQDVSGSVRRT